MRTLPCFLLLSAASCLAAEWPAYGNDPGGSRFSPLTQITRENVSRLKIAWTYRTGALQPESRLNRSAAFEATPILVEGTLYLSTPFNHVIALDPQTGKPRWTYDPGVDRSKSYSEVTSRGVSAWIDPALRPGAPCRLRIFEGTIDARLLALDGATGKPCADFGAAGQIDLTRDVNLQDRGDYQVTSPPAIINGLVIVGSSIGDNRRVEVERGIVRAFDARTGQLRWTWDPLPSGTRAGAANAWSIISADEKRDLLFIPTGSPSPDFYGGERPGDNAHANSVAALRASTGKLVWSFQVVHHDLWDYDVASQPVLVTVGKTAAVAVTTKMGHLFVLRRDTGKPLLPVEERPVPESTVPGEGSWPTQPFPKNPALAPQRLSPDDAWGRTPEDRAWCRDRIASLDSKGIFTPPSLRGAVLFPGNVGGVNWGGAAVHSGRAILVAATNRLATTVRLIPRDAFDAERKRGTQNRLGAEFGSQQGAPYGMYREMLVSPTGLPCNAPPWGALTAVDLATGEKRWETPLGNTPLPGGGSVPGAINLGGPIVTASGLVFISAVRFDDTLRAFDLDTGRELWAAPLPAGAQATPMTYSYKDKQYVVVSAGGHGKAGTKQGDYVIAFALP